MGDMTPPVSQPGSIGAGGGMAGGGNLNSNSGAGGMSGPTIGMNGQAELANPGATLAPNEAQYPISQGPAGIEVPQRCAAQSAVRLQPGFQHPSEPGAEWIGSSDRKAHRVTDAHAAAERILRR